MRFEWTAIHGVARSSFEPEWTPFCDGCHQARVDEQRPAEQLARR